MRLGTIRRFFGGTALGISACFLQANATPLLTVGNGILKPQAIETIIRGVLADALSGSVSQNTLHFEVGAIADQVSLPAPAGSLKTLLDEIGLKENFGLGISPVRANFTLPASALKLSIQNKGPNFFTVKAKWSLSELDAQADALSITVPAGVFDQAFSITSHPVKIAMKSKSVPVEFLVTLNANLTENGTEIKLQGVQTNLTSNNHPEFSAKIGALTVNGQPLELKVQSNGQTVTISEPTIRAELQKLEDTYTNLFRKNLSDLIQTQVSAQMRILEKAPPFHYEFKTDEFTSLIPALSADLRQLLSGIEFSAIPTGLQAIPEAQIYSTEVSAKVCMDGQCLSSLYAPAGMSREDLKTVTYTHQSSALLYESFFQNLIESDAFERRISDYYRKTSTLPGASLAPSAIRVYFEPSMNAVVAILNLEIQIGKTATASDPWSYRLKREVGGWIENEFGSGPVVRIPVPVALIIKGFIQDKNGGTNLVIAPDLSSLKSDGTFIPYSRCSPQECPNNVGAMTEYVRKEFVPTVKQDILKLLPKQIVIPFGTDVRFKNLAFQLKQLLITGNHGFLVNTRTLTSPGVKP